MAHPGRKQRRADKRAERNARKAEKASARARGRSTGDFSESGFGPGEAAPSRVQRIKRAAKSVLEGPARAARREQMRRARGGRIKGQFETGIEMGLGSVLIAGTGGASTVAGSIFRAARVAGPGIALRAARRSAGPIAVGGLTGAAFNVAEGILDRREANMPHRGAGKARGLLPGVGGSLPSKDTVVKTWTTGTANFARLLDGRIAVQKKDGTIKTYRPQKHIVIPRNPRVGTLIRADKRLERLTKGLRKVVRTGKR